MVKEFSQELFKKQQNGNFNQSAFATLEKLKARSSQSENLFEDAEIQEFENLKEEYPKEYELIKNKEAFEELSEEQKRQVLFKDGNGFDRPADVKIIGTIE